MVVVRVRGPDLTEVTGNAGSRALAFARDGQGYWGLAGFGARVKPGAYPLTLAAKTADGRTLRDTLQVKVVDGGYQTENIDLPPESASLFDNKLITAEEQRLQGIFTVITPEKLWDGPFRRPLDTEITSDFGTRRSYNGGPVTSYHEGTDFHGQVGTPIHAPAAGRVVLAEKLTVRGNTVLIDHGLGVYSGLFHMSQIKVQVGQMVKPGDVVGLVGATGLVTGPHLHWDLRLVGLNVDPLEWTQRSFP